MDSGNLERAKKYILYFYEFTFWKDKQWIYIHINKNVRDSDNDCEELRDVTVTQSNGSITRMELENYTPGPAGMPTQQTHTLL